MRLGFHVLLPTVLVFSMASTAAAQQAPASSWGDVAVSVARVDYDLSGVGTAPGLAVRITRNLSPGVSLEAGGLFAKPDQQFGPSALFVPETLVRYRWNARRVSPYIGAGIGAALVKSPFDTDWDPTFAAAAGAAVRLSERVALTGELRLRAHELRFTGTTSDLSVGLAWRLPSF